MDDSNIIYQVDGRDSYRRDENYPQLIFLATVLRWSVIGRVMDIVSVDVKKIVKNNDHALASIGTFLAHQIESGAVPIYNVHTKLLVVGMELDQVLNRLRAMSGRSNVAGLADEDGQNYYLDGEKLYEVVKKSVPNLKDAFQKGGIWRRIVWDALPEWRRQSTNAQNLTVDLIAEKNLNHEIGASEIHSKVEDNRRGAEEWQKQVWNEYQRRMQEKEHKRKGNSAQVRALEKFCENSIPPIFNSRGKHLSFDSINGFLKDKKK